MSYLGVPRLNIAGSFYTDPSTVDNDPAHYDESCVNPSPWQDPTGSHYFSLQDILAGQAPNRAYTAPKVMGAVDKNGNATAEDPIVGTVVASVDAPGGIAGGPFSPAKMIDLDVYQQAVSSIHGFFLQIPVPGTTDSIVAAMDPCVLNSCRFDRVLPTRGWQPWDSYGAGSYGGDTNASGVFQSILRVNPANWPEQTNSTILNELRAACMYDLQGNLVLSIRMTLDGYQNVSYHPEDFRLGRIAATIGPFVPGDASQCIPGRWLAGRAYFGGTQPTFADADPWNQPSLYGAPFVLSQRDTSTVVSIDLSNALMAASPGGAPLDLGNLSLYIGDGSTGVVGQPFQLNDVFYSLGGGIVDLPLTAAQVTAAAAAPFFVVSSRTDIKGSSSFNGLPVLWQESPSGTWIACNDRNLQLPSDQPSPGSGSSFVYMTQWGQPVTNVNALQVGVYPCFPGNSQATVPWAASYAGNSQSSIGALGFSVSLPQPGMFEIVFTALADPGARTPELDSQLYFVCCWPTGTPPPPSNLDPTGTQEIVTVVPPQEQIVSVVLWQSYPLNTNAQFTEIQRIMKVYDKLFPAMHAKMDLTDEQTFFTFSANPPWQYYFTGMPGPMTYALPNNGTLSAGSIPYYLTRDREDPRFMPIMRNLAPNKLLTVLYYCWNLQQGLIEAVTPTTFAASYAREHAAELAAVVAAHAKSHAAPPSTPTPSTQPKETP